MKKKLVLLLVGAFLCVTGYAQKIAAQKVPDPVASAFKEKFPLAKNIEWEMESPDEYEASFKTGTEKHSSVFSADGIWIETETEIKPSAVPAGIIRALEAQFPGFKTGEVCKVENAKHGNCFEAEIKNGNESYEVLLSQDGTVISKKIQKGEAEKN